MNWSSTKLLQGETGLLGFAFVRDLWRFAKVAPPSEKLQFQQTADPLPARLADILHAGLGQCADSQRLADHLDQLLVGVKGLAAATQYAGIAGFQAQGGDVSQIGCCNNQPSAS